MLRLAYMDRLNPQEQQRLRAVALRSIEYGYVTKQPLIVSHEATNIPRLMAQQTSFVTLKIDDRLRGCIGSLQAQMPLIQDVAEHAFAAAFQDPRFAPVTQSEIALLDITISVLSKLTPIHFDSEQALITQLRPHIDGLLLEEGENRSTFLPSVWDTLPEATQFIQNLKQKAGLPAHYWSDTTKVFRYTTESF